MVTNEKGDISSMKKIAVHLVILVIMFTMLGGCIESNSQKDSSINEASKAVETDEINGVDGTRTLENSNNSEFVTKWVNAVAYIQESVNHVPGIDENTTKEERDEMFDSLISDIENGLNDEQIIYYRVCNILALAKSLHMGLWFEDEAHQTFGSQFMIDFIWAKEGLTIFGTDEQYREYLGAVVTRINGYSLKEIIDKYATIRFNETDAGRKNCIYGLCTADLKYLGIMNEEDDSIVLTLHKGKDEEKDVTIHAFAPEDKVNWVSAIETEQLPFTYRIRQESNFRNYSLVEDTEYGIMYFQYLACGEENDESFEDFFDGMMEKMQAQDDLYKTLVIDVRWNLGGNRYILQKQLKQYQDYLDTKRICIITGNFTASAAVHAVEDCLSYFDDVKIYGEPTAGAIHNYTEVKVTSVPEVNLMLQLPTVRDYVPKLVEKYGDVVESVVPDVEVQQSFEDISNGIDTVYQRIIEDIQIQ